MLILPHIAFEGLKLEDAAVTKDSFIHIPTGKIDTAFTDADDNKAFRDACNKPVVDMQEVAEIYAKANTPGDVAQLKDVCKGGKFNPGHGFERKIYRGFSATDASGDKTLTSNAGHLGEVDSLEFCNRVWGTAGGQIYKPRVQTTTVQVKP